MYKNVNASPANSNPRLLETEQALYALSHTFSWSYVEIFKRLLQLIYVVSIKDFEFP